MIFTWDDSKSKSNKKKHGVSFEEAETVFADEAGRLIHDPEHSEDEDRFVLLGMSEMLRVLVVVHAYRDDDKIIRIISARKATKTEQKFYKR